jgi:hypothetical protein
MRKPTEEELINYYQTNLIYFNELAIYYYENDPEYYAKFFAPLYKQHLAGEVVCPYCHRSMVPFDYPSLSPVRIALFSSGIFLFLCSLFLAYFFSALLGVFFILLAIAIFATGFFFKKVKKRCSVCKMPIPYLLMN